MTIYVLFYRVALATLVVSLHRHEGEAKDRKRECEKWLKAKPLPSMKVQKQCHDCAQHGYSLPPETREYFDKCNEWTSKRPEYLPTVPDKLWIEEYEVV